VGALFRFQQPFREMGGKYSSLDCHNDVGTECVDRDLRNTHMWAINTTCAITAERTISREVGKPAVSDSSRFQIKGKVVPVLIKYLAMKKHMGQDV
jgi:hypothetical protein